MDFKWSDLEAKPSNWFELNLRYEGHGHAEFTSPKGGVEGAIVATFDEFGGTSVELSWESMSCDPDYEGMPLGFLCGAEVQKTAKGRTMEIGGFKNPCNEFAFRTANGVFSSTSTVFLSGLTLGGNEQKPLLFHVPEGKFEVHGAGAPKYFVIPLFNCIAEPTSRLLGDHPLRIFPTPRVPNGLSERDKLLANMKADEKNSVVGFETGNKVAFIERLPDYLERAASLEKGTQRRITALLVGELEGQASDLAEFRSWFPFELVSALSFASGVEMGALWVEIRDGDGKLVRRLHGTPRCPMYSAGDVVIGKFCRAPGGLGGIGDFLTRYLKLPLEKRAHLEVAMNHARLGSVGSPARLYDILDHLIRAFECICREHGHVQQNLLASLTSPTQEKVKQIVSVAISGLQQVVNDSTVQAQADEPRVLATIKSRIANVGTTEKQFGLAVVLLLKSFGLPDAGVIDRFFAAHPRNDGLPDWASVLTAYRGATIHEGHMDFEKKHDVNDVVRICLHLRDVLTRILLKDSGYEGTYESVLRRGYGAQPLDWVKPDTPASNLGF
jgi:hypothetical protein